jgi:hypothetical protein
MVRELVSKLLPKQLIVSNPVFGRYTTRDIYPTSLTPTGFDDPEVEELYRSIRSKGLTVDEVPQSTILKSSRKARDVDAVGLHSNGKIYVSRDINGRPLEAYERGAIAAHEEGHALNGGSEKKAQLHAIRRLTKMNWKEAAAEAIKMYRNMGFN